MTTDRTIAAMVALMTADERPATVATPARLRAMGRQVVALAVAADDDETLRLAGQLRRVERAASR